MQIEYIESIFEDLEQSPIEQKKELPTIPIKDIDTDIEIAYNAIMSNLYKTYSTKYSIPELRLYVLKYLTNHICNKTAIELKRKVTTKKNIELIVDTVKKINNK